MEEEEIERLIAELRAMLRETGFGWVAEQAEAALRPATSHRAVALALLDAAGARTVDLAQAELAAIRQLEVEEVISKPDREGNSDGDDNDGGRDLEAAGASKYFDDSDRL